MKTLASFVAICLLMIGNVYAGHLSNDKGQDKYFKKLENKSAFKISERKILTKPKPKPKPKSEIEEDVSSFSMEELRVGAQQVASEAEIKYAKSQCRYAFMSDKEIIENRCEIKKVTLAK